MILLKIGNGNSNAHGEENFLSFLEMFRLMLWNFLIIFFKFPYEFEIEPWKKLESIEKEKLENLKNKLDTIEHLDQLDDELSNVYSKGISSIYFGKMAFILGGTFKISDIRGPIRMKLLGFIELTLK